MVGVREIWNAVEMVLMAVQALSKGDKEAADRFLAASSEILGPEPSKAPAGLGMTEVSWS